MKRYINIKGSTGTETLEEFNTDDYTSLKEFNAALATRVGSYRMIHGSGVYVSQRAAMPWTGN